MSKTWTCILVAAVVAGVATSALAADPSPFVGRWALTIPSGGAGWLGITQEDGYLDASILWGGGSVLPVDSAFVATHKVQGQDVDMVYVTRLRKVDRKDKSGKVVRTHTFTEAIFGYIEGDKLKLEQWVASDKGYTSAKFEGKRIPDLPPAPDLKALKYGAPVQLFNGKNLDGWELVNPGQISGWSVKDGVLVNDAKQEEGKPHIRYGNLRTVSEFEDFNLKLETLVQENGNSGVYLRGVYEVQVADTYGKPLDSHNMGAVYSRITPSVSAEKPAGEWQTMDITLADRHVTVILNGKTIIDNQPLLGCTGGALTSDEFQPGPIYLQGDHTAITYRNIVLTPIID